MSTFGRKMIQCITNNCKCKGQIMHKRKGDIIKSKTIAKNGCKQWGPCQCLKCTSNNKQQQVVLPQNAKSNYSQFETKQLNQQYKVQKCGHRVYQCGNKYCNIKGRQDKLLRGVNGLFYCLVHFNYQKKVRRQEELSHQPQAKIFKTEIQEYSVSVDLDSTRITSKQTQQSMASINSQTNYTNYFLEQTICHQSAEANHIQTTEEAMANLHKLLRFTVKKEEVKKQKSLKEYLIEEANKNKPKPKSKNSPPIFNCNESMIEKIEAYSYQGSWADCSFSSQATDTTMRTIKLRSIEEGKRVKQEKQLVTWQLQRQKRAIYKRYDKMTRPGVYQTSDSVYDPHDRRWRRQTISAAYDRILALQSFRVSRAREPKKDKGKAEPKYGLEDAIKLMVQEERTKKLSEETKEEDESIIVSKSQFMRDVDLFIGDTATEFPIDDDQVSRLRQSIICNPCTNPSRHLGLNLSDDFIKRMKEKFALKCYCKKCYSMHKIHDAASLYWYLEHFGCNFTNMVLENFKDPNGFLFDENYNQQIPLTIKDDSIDFKIIKHFRTLSLSSKAVQSVHNQQSRKRKDNAIRALVRRHLKEFKLTSHQHYLLGGKIRIQLNDQLYTHFFTNNISEQLRKMKKRKIKIIRYQFQEDLLVTAKIGCEHAVRTLPQYQTQEEGTRRCASVPSLTNEVSTLQKKAEDLELEKKIKVAELDQKLKSLMKNMRETQRKKELNNEQKKDQAIQILQPPSSEKQMSKEMKARFLRTEENILNDNQRRLTPIPVVQQRRMTKNTKARMKNKRNKQQRESMKQQQQAQKVYEVNKFENDIGVRNTDNDIDVCYASYMEPRFRYKEQEKYWSKRPQTIETMAHNEDFSNQDLKLTQKFFNRHCKKNQGGTVLTLCEGLCRNGIFLSQFFQKVDICDIKPSFGKLATNKQGKMFKTNLKDIGKFIIPNSYDFIFGNWSLCYISFRDVQSVLQVLWKALRPKGRLMLKEPILGNDERYPRLCSSGQWLLTRPAEELEKWLKTNFIIHAKEDVQQNEDCDVQRIWLLRKKSLVCPMNFKK